MHIIEQGRGRDRLINAHVLNVLYIYSQLNERKRYPGIFCGVNIRWRARIT